MGLSVTSVLIAGMKAHVSLDPVVLYRAGGVFDGRTPGTPPPTGLLVEDGRVVALGRAEDLAAPPRVVEHDLGAGTIVPGFVDAHTHVTLRPGEGDQDGQAEAPAVWQTIRGAENRRRMLASGVTTARIMTEEHHIDYEFRDAIARGELHGPRLLVSGAGLSPPGGHGCIGPGVAGVDALRAAVRDRVDHGADHIKIFTTGGVSSSTGALSDSQYSGAEIVAVVDEAARAGLRVSAHAHGGEGVTLAVANGIHSIEHGVLLSQQNIDEMLARDIWLVLTTTILHHPDGIERGDGADPGIMAKVREARAASSATAERVRAGGVRIAVGTDSMHGLFGHEVTWLVEHGWSPLDALVAATSAGAALIGRDDVGVLRSGARADFVLLDRDPFVDITAVHDVAAVYQDGRRVA
jgi:imidazolonepropionase-like amidohydrolase